MIVKIDRDILKGCYEILKKYFIVQEFTSVNKISRFEKNIYLKPRNNPPEYHDQSL